MLVYIVDGNAAGVEFYDDVRTADTEKADT